MKEFVLISFLRLKVISHAYVLNSLVLLNFLLHDEAKTG